MKDSHTYHVFRTIGILAAVIMLISIFLPYVREDTTGMADYLKSHGVTAFSAYDHGISQFTFALVYANYDAFNLHSSYLIPAVLFFTAWAFTALMLVFLIRQKPGAVITFSALVLFINLFLRWAFIENGIVGSGWLESEFGIGMYLMLILSAAEILLGILMCICRKKY